MISMEQDGSEEGSWPYEVEMKNGDSVMSSDAPPRRLAMRECKQVYDAKADTCVVVVVLNDRPSLERHRTNGEMDSKSGVKT